MSPLALSLRLLQTQPDERLVELAQDGHEPAFEALVRRYRTQLLAYSRRLSAGVVAEDVVQQALLQAWAALRAGAKVRDARAWLYRIVHNATIRAVRSAGAAPAQLEETPTTHGVDQIVEQRLAAREALAHLAALPDLQREVMLGTALEGRSHQELATELGLSGGSVRGLMFRARATLRAAAAALLPTPVVNWAVRAGGLVRFGPRYEALVGGGSVGLAGALIKGGVVATFAGALAGAAAVIGIHPVPNPSHHPQTAVLSGHLPAGTPERRDGAFLLASAITPVRAAYPEVRAPHQARASVPGVNRQDAGAWRTEEVTEPGSEVRSQAPSETRRAAGSDGRETSGYGTADGPAPATTASAPESPSSDATPQLDTTPTTNGDGASSGSDGNGTSSAGSDTTTTTLGSGTSP